MAGNAAQLQTEVNNLESAVGSAVDSNGAFQASAFTGFTNVVSPTSLTDVLSQLDSAMSTNDHLAQLADVNVTGVANGQYLKYDSGSGKWINDTLTLSDVTDVTATATEVNVLHGITATTTELNYVSGVTSAIQTQLNNKQPLDATLSGLAGMTGTGFVVETGVDTFTHRAVATTGAGLSTDPCPRACGWHEDSPAPAGDPVHSTFVVLVNRSGVGDNE